MDLLKAREIFTEFLKRGSSRITPERFEVLEAAFKFKGHFGADELYVALKNKNKEVSRATVYNSLELLTKSNLLIKRNFGDGATRYEANLRGSHEHIICTECGKITEFSAPEIKNDAKMLAERLGYDFSGYNFNLYGRCREHALKNAETKKDKGFKNPAESGPEKKRSMADCPQGKTVKILEVNSGKSSCMSLMNMGIAQGTEVLIKRKSPMKGPLLLLINDTEIAVGYSIAKKIMVEC